MSEPRIIEVRDDAVTLYVGGTLAGRGLTRAEALADLRKRAAALFAFAEPSRRFASSKNPGLWPRIATGGEAGDDVTDRVAAEGVPFTTVWRWVKRGWLIRERQTGRRLKGSRDVLILTEKGKNLAENS